MLGSAKKINGLGLHPIPEFWTHVSMLGIKV